MSEQKFFFHKKIFFFSTNTLMIMMIMKMSVMISRMNFLILNKYWECHDITEYLKYYSWNKHALMLTNKWVLLLLYSTAKLHSWKWWCRICGGILGFYLLRQIFFQSDSFFFNCLTDCHTSCLGFSICLSEYPTIIDCLL